MSEEIEPSLMCRSVPDQLNSRKFLIDHFQRFGELVGISCCKSGKYCIVKFTNKTSARAAKENGTSLNPNYPPIEIHYTTLTPSSKYNIQKDSVSPEDSSVPKTNKTLISTSRLGVGTGRGRLNLNKANLRSLITPLSPDERKKREISGAGESRSLTANQILPLKKATNTIRKPGTPMTLRKAAKLKSPILPPADKKGDKPVFAFGSSASLEGQNINNTITSIFGDKKSATLTKPSIFSQSSLSTNPLTSNPFLAKDKSPSKPITFGISEEDGTDSKNNFKSQPSPIFLSNQLKSNENMQKNIFSTPQKQPIIQKSIFGAPPPVSSSSQIPPLMSKNIFGSTTPPQGFKNTFSTLSFPHESSEEKKKETSLSRGSLVREGFKTPPKNSARNSGSSGFSTISIETDKQFEELVSKPALSNEDKYKVLDARDKLLRKRNPKVRVRVEFAVRLRGTCTDMCPEKERFMRDVQRRLSSFEYEPYSNTLSHSRAVKEYSRSSADQEEPLLHELRSMSALTLTFDYLLHNIVKRVEEEEEGLGDWYYFIWDRTRSIRKDMTQQQYGDLEAVALMEKCTRFHIYCSTRLCEMDRHAFDPKLNDENLMKCLQSLEHMYTDLNLKGVRCPNEPEFRAYQILMNLNEGDILWEMERKSERILNSPEVRLAMKIYMVLDQKNSVGFFRLVRSAPFMTACILHRYFFQIRTATFKRFLKTFSLKASVSLPLYKMKEILGFGSGEENMFVFKYFCTELGIDKITESTISMSNRNLFEIPSTAIVNREFELIESKLKVSVIEAINGGRLGPNPLETYVPTSSFDNEGYLKDEIISSLIKRTKNLNQPPLETSPSSSIFNRLGTRAPENNTGSFVAKPIFGISNTTSSSSAINNFSFIKSEPNSEEISKKRRLAELKAQRIAAFCEETLQDLLNEVIEQELIRLSKEAIKEEVEFLRREKIKSTSVNRLKNQIEKDVSSDLIGAICKNEVRKAKIVNYSSLKLEEKYREGVLSECVRKICGEIHRKELNAQCKRLKRLDELSFRIHLRSWFLHWKNFTLKCKEERVQFIERQKQNIENFPPITTFQLSPEIILGEWNCPQLHSPSSIQHKIQPQSSRFQLVERCSSIRKSFTSSIEHSLPSIVHNIREPLIAFIKAASENGVVERTDYCSQYEAPRVFNFGLVSEFGPYDNVSNWLWATLVKDTTPLADPSYIGLCLTSNFYLTFQKCSNVSKMSSDSTGLILFLNSPSDEVLISSLKSSLRRPTVLFILNLSKNYTEKQIRAHITSPLVASLVIISPNDEVVESIPHLASGLNWLARNAIGVNMKDFNPASNETIIQDGGGGAKFPPLAPIALLPLNYLISELFGKLYRVVKGNKEFCGGEGIGVHNLILSKLKDLVVDREALGVVKFWPGRATKLVVERSLKRIRFREEEGRLGVVIRNLEKISQILKLEVPEELLHEFHKERESRVCSLSKEEFQKLLKELYGNVVKDGVFSDQFLTKMNHFYSFSESDNWSGISSLPWNNLISNLQEYKIECLDKMLQLSSHQVCVNLATIKKIEKEIMAQFTPCSICAKIKSPEWSRKRGNNEATPLQTPREKIPCYGTETPVLKYEDFKNLLQALKEEKKNFETSIADLSTSF